MRIKTLIFAMICLGVHTNAFSEWYFRGTSNDWQAAQMEQVSLNHYQICQTFGSGDNGGQPRFKIDRFGDWSESYPAQDQSVSGNSSYKIEFIPANHSIQVTSVNDCSGGNSGGLKQQFSSLFFRGTANNWQTSAMKLVADHTWELVVEFDGQPEQRFKFDINGDWSENYGDDQNDSVLDVSGADIFTDVAGSYKITVNDQTLNYQLTLIGNSVEDNWYFRGTSNNWGTSLMGSTDQINFCIAQAFNTGDATDGPRFKIDHFADWTESYPEVDYLVDPNSDYQICFNSQSKTISAIKIDGPDTEAPSVSVFPPAGIYSNDVSVVLSVQDNQDTSPKLYYTTDGSNPTTTSKLYTGESIVVTDISSGIDLEIQTLAIDGSGNQSMGSYIYRIAQGQTTTDFREETIYFLLTARFYDGDPSNNYYNRDRVSPGDPHWRGDFKGLIAQLDYIKDLGFTAIWVTPPVENRSGLDYHGYHAYDWNKVDPRLESPGGTYKDFIDAAHGLGLKVIQDVVINHSSQYGIRDKVWIDHLPIKYFVPEGSAQGLIDNEPYIGNLGDYQSINRDDNDNSVAPDWFKERHNSDPDGVTPLVDPKTGVTVPLAGYDPNRFFGIDAQGLDPNWYHLDGFIAGGDWENPIPLQRKHLAGDTIDLATENQIVREYLNQAIKSYLDMGVDGIRLDTAKHIERDELISYVHEWQAHKPGLFVFGEVLVKGLGFGSEIINDNASSVIRPWWYTRTGSNPSVPEGDSSMSVLDFPLFSTFRDNITKGNFSGVKGAIDLDWTYADPTQLVTFFQNHDVGPDNDFKYRYCCDEGNAAMAYNLLWTIRGIPSLYYGEEIMFKAGAPQDIQSNNDTVDQTGRAYFGPHLDDIVTTQLHPIYQHIKRLNLIRKSIPALQKGIMENVNEWGAGMSFVRNHEASNSYAVVGLASGVSQTISVNNLKNGTYRDAVTGQTIQVSNGSMSFQINPFSAGIYVLNGSGKIGDSSKYLN